jgi:hypothetical protein
MATLVAPFGLRLRRDPATRPEIAYAGFATSLPSDIRPIVRRMADTFPSKYIYRPKAQLARAWAEGNLWCANDHKMTEPATLCLRAH